MLGLGQGVGPWGKQAGPPVGSPDGLYRNHAQGQGQGTQLLGQLLEGLLYCPAMGDYGQRRTDDMYSARSEQTLHNFPVDYSHYALHHPHGAQQGAVLSAVVPSQPAGSALLASKPGVQECGSLPEGGSLSCRTCLAGGTWSPAPETPPHTHTHIHTQPAGKQGMQQASMQGHINLCHPSKTRHGGSAHDANKREAMMYSPAAAFVLR